MLLCSCSGNREKAEEKRNVTRIMEERPVTVKVQHLEYTDFNHELITNGTIAARRKANLRFQSREIIRKIHVRNGQAVKQGQKIAELDTFKLYVALKQACDALDRARLELHDVLIGQGYTIGDSARITPADVMKIAKIRSNYEQGRTNHEVARHDLEAATLRAPFDGVIANLDTREFNQPDDNPFCTVIDNRSPDVVFYILESEISFVQPDGELVVHRISHPGEITGGRITEINPVVDKNEMVKIKAILDDRNGRFYEGMNVKIHIRRLLGKRLVVPKSAVVLRTNRQVVFVHENGHARWVYVETAQENSNSLVVTSGLNAGDEVIYDGNLYLTHEARVEVTNKGFVGKMKKQVLKEFIIRVMKIWYPDFEGPGMMKIMLEEKTRETLLHSSSYPRVSLIKTSPPSFISQP